jgi:hypothetical protein
MAENEEPGVCAALIAMLSNAEASLPVPRWRGFSFSTGRLRPIGENGLRHIDWGWLTLKSRITTRVT